MPIANIDLPDQPSGFHFTVAPAQGGETVLKIKGVMNGTADLTFPFTADLDGELDCKSKTFTANMSKLKKFRTHSFKIMKTSPWP